MEVVDAHANLTLDLQLAAFDFHCLDSGWGLGNDVLAKLCQCIGGKQLLEGTGLCKLPEPLKVTCILMHWDVDNTIQDCDNLVLTFETFFKFNVFVPEWMSKEVETNTVGTTFEEPVVEG